MDIKRRMPPQKQQSTQGGVQFRKRVFDRSQIGGDQAQDRRQKPAASEQRGSHEDFFSRFRTQMSSFGGGMRSAATTPKQAYKSLADKSRRVTRTIVEHAPVSLSADEKTTSAAAEQVVETISESAIQTPEDAVQVAVENEGPVAQAATEQTTTQDEIVMESVDASGDAIDPVEGQSAESPAIPLRASNVVARAWRRTARRLFGGTPEKPLASIRVWQVSMIGAMVFGMVTMSTIMWNFGQSARASDTADIETLVASPMGSLVETQDFSDAAALDAVPNPGAVVAAEVKSAPTIIEDVTPLPPKEPQKSAEQVAFEERVSAMVAGYPIEAMLPEIFKQDREVAAYIIAMAKIESAWGQRVPVLNGQDCFNYWGYRAKRARMGTGGHTCFDSHADAVETVGKRIAKLVYTYEKKTPRQMLVWKCGSSCATHDPAGVERWVGVVAQYRNQALGL